MTKEKIYLVFDGTSYCVIPESDYIPDPGITIEGIYYDLPAAFRAMEQHNEQCIDKPR